MRAALPRRAVALTTMAAFAALAFGPALAQPPERPIGDGRLAAIATRYFAEVWRQDPVRATRAGVHDYDDRLPDLSADAFAQRIALARRTLTQLRDIDPATFGAEGSYDARILESSLETSLITFGTREAWRHDPSYYTNQAASGILALLSRDFAPLHERARNVVAREREIPHLLEQGAANVGAVDATTASIVAENIKGAITFFTAVVPPAVAPVKDAALVAQFKTANEAAVAALQTYLANMQSGPLAHPSGTFAIGPKLFARLLELQELDPIALQDYERAGESALAATKAEYVETAHRIDASKSPEAVAAALGAQHPAANDLLRKAAADLVALRKFVVAKKLLTLPPDDDVKVVPTPEFARQTTFASMNAPGPLEKKATEAYFNVTPVEPAWPAGRQEEHLAFFNDYAFPLVGAHEVMPGHYVNFALDKHESLTLIRRLLASSSFAEGWAHYVEQMMVDEGWGNGDPHVRLAQLQLALQRECRLLVGLREHTQGMTVAEATRFFRENAFMGEGPSYREALRGTQDPLYGYYTLGKLEILKLRDDVRAQRGARFNLGSFHDELLSHGDPPIAIVRKIMLGADDDGKLL